jgi:putative nucleotidyltransferase with HDIG domain
MKTTINNDSPLQGTLRAPSLEAAASLLRSSGFTWKQTASAILAFAIPAVLFLTTQPHRPGVLAGRAALFLLYFVFFCLFAGRRLTGKRRSEAEVILLAILASSYFCAVYFMRRAALFGGFMPSSLALPTALVVMLVSISVSTRLGMVIALMLPLGALLSGCLDFHSYIAATASGAAAALLLGRERRRMDMVKAGVWCALANIAAVSAILLLRACPSRHYPFILFWAAVNGIASGMLTLGVLPLIENALGISTAFRLIELLDTSAPLLRKLESTAPGTYTHSMVLASLAEAACREIGANALLARVGAYYHDVGKIDNPDYFVENQTGGNKHDELNPRLSATVIRSHVKLGVEKARAAGLPRDVIDIIAEHHGDAPILWFYSEAVSKEGQADVEDFRYPGNPPRSREAAVVMLADVTEAATRTLEKPTLPRVERLIDELFRSKYDGGQLAESALTFRDLKTIKSSFARVLVSYHHSRIEYPKPISN